MAALTKIVFDVAKDGVSRTHVFTDAVRDTSTLTAIDRSTTGDRCPHRAAGRRRWTRRAASRKRWGAWSLQPSERIPAPQIGKPLETVLDVKSCEYPGLYRIRTGPPVGLPIIWHKRCMVKW